jgi:hypothetical protein
MTKCDRLRAIGDAMRLQSVIICLACVLARREGRPWGCGCEWDRVLP